VHAGDKAEHRKFKVKGDVVSVDGAKAVLNVNGRKMQVETRDLSVIQSEAKDPLAKHRGGASPSSRLSMTLGDEATVGAELNLIGQRVDDAIEASDKFLDRALLEGKQAVRLIHGYGTGTLRKALRDYLRKHPAVKSWRPGNDNEGGDGATVAVLEG
jgi:DNA mismatch repair protein MutS2